MSAEDEIRFLKDRKPISKEEKQRNIKTSIALATSTVVSIFFLVFAFNQKRAAEKQIKELKLQLENCQSQNHP